MPGRRHLVLESIARPAPSPDYYLSVTDLNVIDAQVFLHQLEDVCPNVRAADVLFFGDSRLQFAMNTRDLRAFFADQRLRFFLLGFPLGTDTLAREILARCGARPRLAVVHETGFLVGAPKRYDQIALQTTLFDALKNRGEFELAFQARRWLHRLLPHPVGRDLGGGSWILYRSIRDGSWFVAAASAGNIPVFGGRRAIVAVPREHLVAAEEFKAEIERRGGELAIAYVASESVPRARAYTIARHLGVPFLDPRIDDLRTADGSHLLPDSARRYGVAFLNALRRHLPDPIGSPRMDRKP